MMDRDEARLMAFGMVLVFLLASSFIGCAWYVEGVLPAKMAEHNMCWDVAQRAYQRCK